MEDGRAEVELTIQIGADTEEEVLSILQREARKLAKKLLAAGKSDTVEEQWCAGAMRVIVRRTDDVHS